MKISRSFFSVVRSTVLEVEAEIFAVFADVFHAFNGAPAGSTFSVLVIVFVAGDGWKRSSRSSSYPPDPLFSAASAWEAVAVSAESSASSIVRTGSFSQLLSWIFVSSRKLVPAGLHFSVLKGIVGTVDLFVDSHFRSRRPLAVKVVPGIPDLPGHLFLLLKGPSRSFCCRLRQGNSYSRLPGWSRSP